MYRYLDRYDDELDLVRRALAADPNWQYMIERKTWHDLPEFQRMRPRPALYLERDPLDVPRRETVETLCFVTGGDSAYFPLMLECIESIKATRYYKDTPINIIDCGLTAGEKETLSTYLAGGSVRDPGWLLEIAEFHKLDKETGKPYRLDRPPNRYKAIANKAFLDEIFPGYSYYFWINANHWVQDERAIDAYLKLCEKQAMVFPDASPGNARPLRYAPVDRIRYIPEKYREAALTVRHGCDAVFCIKASLLHEVRKIIRDFVRLNDGIYFYYFFEFAQSVIRSKRALISDPPIKYYAHFSYLAARSVGYRPMVFDHDPHVIFMQHSPNHPIGILRPVGFDGYAHTLFVQDSSNQIIGERRGSTRFRTHPWLDKPRLEELLRQGPVQHDNDELNPHERSRQEPHDENKTVGPT